ncbi:BT_3987 domain-containing protein [Bacteroides sp. LFL-34]|uniref:BT_3987 domain-containing protein n=1 Tax=Bacteroides sp. LFL-34 TaxID=2994968 RepID=UPI0022B56BE7|nr:DUF1735 domain-containing protein [Bacteroides sp. LFL-34]
MNMINNIKYAFLPVVMFTMATFTSCEEDIEIGNKIDESSYLASTQLSGLLLDENTNKNSSVIELRNNEYSTNVVFRLSKLPQKGVDVQIAVEESYAAIYNTIHETDFEVFPAANVKIANNGTFVFAPDDKVTPSVKVTLTAFDGMEEDKTYIVPLTVTSSTEGVTFTETSKHMVLLVQDYRNKPNTNKGEDAVQTVLYFEVNDTNPLNALEFLTESGKYFFDHIVLFAANINWDPEKQRVYLANNENVQFLLDNNDKYLQPLRKAGMKIIISILGNHDEAGVAQLSDMGAREFARELAAYCRAYNLDGVAFDDEYSNSPDLSNPWLASPSAYAGSRLMYECKAVMPEKIVSLYNLGNMYSSSLQVIDGIEPGQYCDYAVADYGGAAGPGTGMTLKQCAGMSIELRRGSGNSSESTARSRKEAGYGYYMFFALDPSLYGSQVYRCQSVCKGLYDETLVYPSYYYKKNSTEREAIN